MKWSDKMPWSLFFGCWVLSQLFHSLLSSSSRGSLDHLLKDGRGIGQGDHFLPHKFIKRSFEHWASSTKQLLNTGRGHQAPRKAAHSLWKEVGQNIKETKELGTETYPGEGTMKKLPNTRKPFHLRVCGEFWNLRGQHNQEEKINKIHRLHA